jgi:hypothetical protein
MNHDETCTEPTKCAILSALLSQEYLTGSGLTNRYPEIDVFRPALMP